MTIKTIDQANQFLTTMQLLYPLVHPEDDLKTIEDHRGNQTFNDLQIKYLTDRFTECYTLLEDPCTNILEVIRPNLKNYK